MPQVRFVGIAGPQMEAAGCEAWYPLETLAVRGFVEVRRAPAASCSASARALARAAASPSACPLFVGVDAPDFNLGPRAQAQARAACAPSTS